MTKPRDSRRLDWLGRNPRSVIWGVGAIGSRGAWMAEVEPLVYSAKRNIRRAIDAAIKSAKSGEGRK